jgi:hypothetical protein
MVDPTVERKEEEKTKYIYINKTQEEEKKVVQQQYNNP